jgi:hypothetical protein
MTDLEITFKAQLQRLGAWPTILEWVGDRTLSEAWAECERADWLIWLCGRMMGRPGWPGVTDVLRAACACVRTGLKYLPPHESRPLRAIRAVEDWLDGRANIDAVRAARADALAASDDSRAAYAAGATYAPVHVARASVVLAYAACAAAVSNASNAARDATVAVSYVACAYADDADADEKEMAEIVRHMLTIPSNCATEYSVTPALPEDAR